MWEVRTIKALISGVPRIVSIDVNVVMQGYELYLLWCWEWMMCIGSKIFMQNMFTELKKLANSENFANSEISLETLLITNLGRNF
jgi:hypothetical protein